MAEIYGYESNPQPGDMPYDQAEQADTGIVECGYCSTQVEITREQWDTEASVPCPECGTPQDIRFHKRHAEWPA